MVIATVVVGVAYLRWAPAAPDLAAQVARASAARGGHATWWSGWYAGLSLPTYSLVAPGLMATLGVRLVGSVAIVVTAAASLRVTEGTLRPRLGAWAIVVFSVADLLNGRVTFTAGIACALWAVAALRAGKPAPTAVFALAAWALSPLAGLFLGIVFLAVVLVDPARRPVALIPAAGLGVVAIGVAVLFPGTGTMPFALVHAVAPAICCAAVLVLCPIGVIRAIAGVLLVLFLVCLLVPTPVGSNVTRLVWIGAVPTVVACAPAPRWLLPVTAVLLAIWPVSDLTGQLEQSTLPSARAAFYRPLQTEVTREQALAGSSAQGQRLELVDTVNHWGNTYLDCPPAGPGLGSTS